MVNNANSHGENQMQDGKNQVQMGISLGNSKTFRKHHSKAKMDKLKASLKPFRPTGAILHIF